MAEMRPRMQPGAMRDALASLSEHTRGGDPYTAASLQRRLGISATIARERLAALAARGLAVEHLDRGPQPEYEITDVGRAMLG